MINDVIRKAGAPGLVTVAPLDVTKLGNLRPELLVCDIDRVEVDGLELLRRIRFVLPDCTIVVFTAASKRTWGLAAHNAGANCLLSKDTDERGLVHGLRSALQFGCFTDPHLAA